MSHLFSPIRIGALELPNRIVVSPMCQYSGENGNPSAWHRAHLGQFVIGGAGLVFVEATGVEPAGRISQGCLGLYSDENAESMARLVADLRRVGPCRLAIQLAHAGRKGSHALPWEGGRPLEATATGGWQTLAPSAIPLKEGLPVPKAMDQADIDRVVKGFGLAAKRAAAAGFDVLEIHAAHGYLVHEFLSPHTNKRTDAYGGSLENRMRFPLACFKAMRDNWPAGKPLGARISGSDWRDGGFGIEETLVFAERLKAIGADFLDVSSGGLLPDAKITVGPGYQVQFATAVKRAIGLPTCAVGLITGAKQAEAIIAAGEADMVALGRGMMNDPRWPWRAAEELGDAMPYPPQYLRAKPGDWPGWKARPVA